jgi:hypothetical protein
MDYVITMREGKVRATRVAQDDMEHAWCEAGENHIDADAKTVTLYITAEDEKVVRPVAEDAWTDLSVRGVI